MVVLAVDAMAILVWMYIPLAQDSLNLYFGSLTHSFTGSLQIHFMCVLKKKRKLKPGDGVNIAKAFSSGKRRGGG